MDPQAINWLALLLLPRHQWPWNIVTTDLPPPEYVFFQLGAMSYFWSLLDISKPSTSALHLLALFLGTRNNNQPTRSHDPSVMWLISQLYQVYTLKAPLTEKSFLKASKKGRLLSRNSIIKQQLPQGPEQPSREMPKAAWNTLHRPRLHNMRAFQLVKERQDPVPVLWKHNTEKEKGGRQGSTHKSCGLRMLLAPETTFL